MKTTIVSIMLLLAMVGCAMAPNPVLIDFADHQARVAVEFNGFGRPKREEAQVAALPVAIEHCRSVGRSASPVSSWINEVESHYLFLYRCD